VRPWLQARHQGDMHTRDGLPTDGAGRALFLAVLPTWGIPGLVDWWLHRRSAIEEPGHGGVRESLLHILMFAEGSVPLGLALGAEFNAAALALLAGSAVLHELTARWDLTIASNSAREVTPGEQQIHTALEAIPFVVCLLALLHGMAVNDPGGPRWRLRAKAKPLPLRYVLGIGALTGATGAAPQLEELIRCLRQAKLAPASP
jgi:hypothetical protein